MRGLHLALIAVLTSAVGIVIAYSFSYYATITNVGSVRAVGGSISVYWDMACSRRVSEIAWGMLDPGENKTVAVYVRNEGTSLVALSLYTESWEPSEASRFIGLSWDYRGQWLAPGAVLAVNLCLSVSPDIQGVENFRFVIVISAEEF